MKIKFVFFVFLFFIFCVNTILACSCVQQDICQFYSNAKVVFIGKVLDSTEKTREIIRREKRIGSSKWEENTYAEKRQISRLQIIESFTGTENKSEFLIETELGNSCALPLEKNNEYLIYANKSKTDENFIAYFCSGTKPLSVAQKDLTYLRENKNNSAVVQGKVFVGDWWKSDFPLLSKNNITTVILQNETQKLSAEIQKDNSFLFSKVPPGTYKIVLDLPEIFQIKNEYSNAVAKEFGIGDQNIIDVSEHGCAVKDFLIVQKRKVRKNR